MAMKTDRKYVYLSGAAGAVLALGLAGGSAAQADANPFAVTELGSGYMVAANAEGKCGGAEKSGEGKCGGSDKSEKRDKATEGKCAAKKDGGEADKKGGEGKCGEGKCASA